jgi:6-phosphogluconate dehydrogenase
MEIGMVGLGRMGGNMARRLLSSGHRVLVYDPISSQIDAVVAVGAVPAASIEDMIAGLKAPRVVWLMTPAGEPTESTIRLLGECMSKGDTVVDGGNSYYKDSIRRAKELSEKGIDLLDAGVSGGVWGLKEGYCLMVGGDSGAYKRVEPALTALAPGADCGYGHVGRSGAGHFVKMVHNGIEYGLMQAYAEGFELMQAKEEYDLDLHQIAELWRHGSVVRSWLLDLATRALEEDPRLEGIQSYVEDSGEGRWTAQEAIDLGIPAPVITQSLQVRFRSRQAQPFGGRLLAALRNQFGGHRVREAPEK